MTDHPSASDRKQLPKVATILGGLGLLPFQAGPVSIVIGEPPWAGDALRYYAATILAFMGGVHWGLAIGQRGDSRDEPGMQLQLIASVIPSLVAWIALFMPLMPSLSVMALAFAMMLVGDLMAARRGWTPAWYGPSASAIDEHRRTLRRHRDIVVDCNEAPPWRIVTKEILTLGP